jgi:hypothetical protein
MADGTDGRPRALGWLTFLGAVLALEWEVFGAPSWQPLRR